MSDNVKDNQKIGQLRVITEFLRVVLWPIVALVVIFICKSPLYKTLEKLPDLVSNSDVITIGKFSLKVDKKLGSKISPEVRNIIQLLDGQEVLAILTNDMALGRYNIPPTWSYSFDKDMFWEDQLGGQSPLMLSLVKKGIFEKTKTENDDIEPERQHVSFEITKEGQKVRQFLIDLIYELKQSM